MKIDKTLQNLLNADGTDAPLQKKSGNGSGVRALQIMLYGLGFGKALNWQKFKADGDYGGGTSTAIRAFLEKNGLDGDGESLPKAILHLMLQRYGLAPAFRRLQQSLDAGTLAAVYANGQSAQQDLRQLAVAAKVTLAAGVPTEAEARALLDVAQKWYGDDWSTTNLPGEEPVEPTVQEGKSTYVVSTPWISATFKKQDRGVSNVGDTEPLAFVQSGKQDLMNLNFSDSAVRVIAPISNNEGKLEAVNTWDNAFLSFGMFQWTLGTNNGAGELPALLNRLKSQESQAFQEYFGRHGLDISSASRTMGFLSLNGQKLDSAARKEALRKDIRWAWRFWSAGLDPRVQLVQIAHALDRINSFQFHDEYRPLGKFFIGDLITSEYGMCLILDHHVNRPGHLTNFAIGKVDILGKALKNAGLADSDPAQWKTAEETKLINAYLPLRFASSMTHAQLRAERIEAAMKAGELNAERNSFVLQALGSRNAAAGLPLQANYPRIDHKEYEKRKK